MKSSSFVAIFLALPLLLLGCNREEITNEQLMSSFSAEPSLLAADSLDRLVETNPTAAGKEAIPVWQMLSYSEKLGDAYAERMMSQGEAVFEND